MAIPIPVVSSLLDIGKSLIARKWPDPLKQAEEIRKLEELAQNERLAELNAEVTMLAGQMEINKVEAGHSSVFVAAWRPFLGWVGGFSLAYASILEPLMRFVATMMGYEGDFPEIDTNLTIQVVLGMLGIAGLRSYDKKQGTSTRSVGDMKPAIRG